MRAISQFMPVLTSIKQSGISQNFSNITCGEKYRGPVLTPQVTKL